MMPPQQHVRDVFAPPRPTSRRACVDSDTGQATGHGENNASAARYAAHNLRRIKNKEKF